MRLSNLRVKKSLPSERHKNLFLQNEPRSTALSLSTLKSLFVDLQSKLFYFYKSFNLQLRNPLPLKFKHFLSPFGEKKNFKMALKPRASRTLHLPQNSQLPESRMKRHE